MFFKEESATDTTVTSLRPWRVLLVDDEPDIHTVTKLALARFTLDGRPLAFLHAYSAAEAKHILSTEHDIALVFLDVVMESDSAGLEVARWMRHELGNLFTRIVLRTGQPGTAPEERVIVDYDINDYKEKTELDRTKLFTTTFSALRAYRDIMRVEETRRYEERYRIGLQKVIEASAHVLEHRSIQAFANGLLEQVISLLRLDEQSLLVRLDALSEDAAEDGRYEIMAGAGNYSPDGVTVCSEILPYLDKARLNRANLREDDVFVLYFPTRQGKANLLFLKGISLLDDLDQTLIQVFSGSVALAFENLLLNREIFDTQAELINRLGDAVESRSPETGNHVRRIAEFCYELGKGMGLDDELCELLKRAAPMHDIGKISTPDAVLLKPGKLEVEEWNIMKEHPERGHRILSSSNRPILQMAATIALQHHERFDGGGYPQGLRGEEIDLMARIVAVADVYDALSHQRCYKPAWSKEAVIQYLEEQKGKQLDPIVVELLLEKLPILEQISQRYQD